MARFTDPRSIALLQRRTAVVRARQERLRAMARVASAARLPGVELHGRQAAPDKAEPAPATTGTGSYAPPIARERSLR